MATEVKQYFTSYRTASWNAPENTVPQEGADDPLAPVQPTGWVINSSANVFIDDEGLHIFDGAIFLNDYSGASVLTANGFTGSWLAYLLDGLYNSRFEFGENGALTYGASDMIQVAYWYFFFRTNAGLTLSRIEDTTTPGGYAMRFHSNGVTMGSATQLYGLMASASVPIMGGRRLIVRALWRTEQADASNGVRMYALVYFYDASGAFLSNSLMAGNTRTGSAAAGVYTWDNVGVVTAPQNAATMKVTIGPSWDNGVMNTGSLVDIAEVQGRQAEDDFINILLGYNTFETFQGVVQMRNDAFGMNFRLLSENGFPADFMVIEDGESYARMKIGTDGLYFGSGVLNYDAHIFRSAAGVVQSTAEIRSYLEQWITPTMLNSWVTYSAEYNPPGYRKDAQGYVHLRGMVKNGTAVDATMFTLPVGYRPAYRQLFIGSAGGPCRIDVKPTGDVQQQVAAGGYVAATAWVSLDGITFKAEA